MTIAVSGNGQIAAFAMTKDDLHKLQDFHKENENKPAGELLNMAENGHLENWQKASIGQELQHRLDRGEIGKDCSPEEKKELQGLLDNMKKGQLSPDGAERLETLLHASSTAGHDHGGIN